MNLKTESEAMAMAFPACKGCGEETSGDDGTCPDCYTIASRVMGPRIAELEAELAVARSAAWAVRDFCTCAKVSNADIERAVAHARAQRSNPAATKD